MSRIDDIRARVQAAPRGVLIEGTAEWAVGDKSDGIVTDDFHFASNARADVLFLLDLVERAVPLIEEGEEGDYEAAVQWLREVRNGR